MEIRKNRKITIWWELSLRKLDAKIGKLFKDEPLTDVEKAVTIQSTADPDEELFDIIAKFFNMKRCPYCEGKGVRNED